MLFYKKEKQSNSEHGRIVTQKKLASQIQEDLALNNGWNDSSANMANIL